MEYWRKGLRRFVRGSFASLLLATVAAGLVIPSHGVESYHGGSRSPREYGTPGSQRSGRSRTWTRGSARRAPGESLPRNAVRASHHQDDGLNWDRSSLSSEHNLPPSAKGAAPYETSGDQAAGSGEALVDKPATTPADQDEDTRAEASRKPSPIVNLWQGFKDWLGFGDNDSVENNGGAEGESERPEEDSRGGTGPFPGKDPESKVPASPTGVSASGADKVRRGSQTDEAGSQGNEDVFETPPDGGVGRGQPDEGESEGKQTDERTDGDEDEGLLINGDGILNSEQKEAAAPGDNTFPNLASKKVLSETDIRMMVTTLHKLFQSLDDHLLSRSSLGLGENEIQNHHSSSPSGGQFARAPLFGKKPGATKEIGPRRAAGRGGERNTLVASSLRGKGGASSLQDPNGNGAQSATSQPGQSGSIIDSILEWLDGSRKQIRAPHAPSSNDIDLQ